MQDDIKVIPANEPERLRALKNYEILNSLRESDFDRITQLATLICGTPISLITLLDEHRQWFKSKIGLDIDETPRELAFCRYTILENKLFLVEDAALDDRFKDNDLVTGSPDIRFYAGFPLTDAAGYNLGTICVIDRIPRALTDSQKKALELLAKEVTNLIQERRQRQELQNFESLFKLSPDLICIAGTDGYFRKVNPAFQKLLGLETEQLLSTSFYDFLHPDDLQAAARQIANMQSGHQVLNFVARVRSASQQYRSIAWAASPEKGTGNLFAVGRDLTEELAREERLVDSEAKLRAFFENSQGMMGTHDLSGRFLSVNTAGAAMIGYTREEVLEKTLFDLVAENQHPMLLAYLEKLAGSGSSQGEVTLLHKDGTSRIWLFNNSLQTSSNGEQYVIANAVDITERYKMEKNLQRTKKMLEETNQVARIGGWQIDMERQRMYWSPVTKEIHGVPRDYKPELQTGINFFKEGESRALISQAVRQAMLNGSPWNLDLQIVNTQGKEVWVRAIGKAEMKDGACQRLYGTFQDIDEKKKGQIQISESRAVLAAFVEHAPAAVAMLNKDLRFIAVSNCWIEDYKLGDIDIAGTSYYDVFPNLSPESKARHQRILQGAVERNAEDMFVLVGENTERYVAWEMRPWYQLSGEIGGIMVYTQDVTRMVEQREQLRIAKIQAEQASRAKSEFLANMSHEIRTPLNGVIGFTDLVLKTQLSDTQQQYLTIVNQSANALLGIINDILDFSKIEAGKLDLDIDQCDLYEISADTTDIISFQVQQKGLEMLLNLAPNLPRFIWVDSVRLRQILVNLLTNAAKFTEHGEIELKIEELSRTSGQATLRFTVRDTGIGIKPEKQHKIFDAFSQEDASTTKRYGGTGLGLTISNRLLEMMGSRLQLLSSPGKGSSFFFDIALPVAEGEAIEWHNLDRIREVLIVDDNENNRKIIQQMLALKNIASSQAKNGLDALQMLAAGKKFDAVIMDYDMPFMNGLETIGKIREAFYATKEDLAIILLSSSSDSEAVTKNSEALHVNRRLLKPVKMQDLYGVLSQLYQKTNLDSDKPGNAVDLPAHLDFSKILIVEDNQVNMLLAVTIVKRLMPNAEIVKAENGIEAIERCRQSWPDLILMDVQMPEMNGLEATRQLREVEPAGGHIPIIALTASNVKEERDACLASGMDDFIVKPVVEVTIAQALTKWLGVASRGMVGPADIPDEHFDPQRMEQFVGSDPELVSEVLRLTMQQLLDGIDQLRTCIATSDLDGIKALGHKLYGTAVTAAIGKVARIARDLEHTQTFDKDKLSLSQKQLQQEVTVVAGLIASFLDEMDSS